MNCAWQPFINILPHSIRQDVDRLGRDRLLELRLRMNRPVELICSDKNVTLNQQVNTDILQFVINSASRYSPWTANTVSDGYITTQGGHRIGLCGEAVLRDGKMTDIKHISSLCIRIARDFPGIGRSAPRRGSLLILGRPGSGKTTLLRDIIRIRSEREQGSICVVDERMELFPLVQGRPCFPPGSCTDILSGCPKTQGIQSVLRTMGPTAIALDEITAKEDCDSLLEAMWCGVDLLATAHAGSIKDFMKRPIYKPLIDSSVFQIALVMQPDKTWREERIFI